MGYYKEEIVELLEKKNIPYRMKEHKAVFTMEEMDEQGITQLGKVCKNLFLRNNKGKMHFLVCLPEEKQANLKNLGEILDNQKLSFASEERLLKYLGVTHGAVSPLGVLNDDTDSVIVILDRELMEWSEIGVHPNDNTATIWITPDKLEEILKLSGNPYRVCEI